MTPAMLLSLAFEAGGRPSLRPVFEPPPRTYNYAPCFVQDSDADVRWMFYCANREPGVVTDSLCFRRACHVGGEWQWAPEQVALSPSPDRDAWDSRHVCDPEVLRGRFRMDAREYEYALFYLGTDAEDSTHNQVGVAFAESLEGPWTRYPEPIVTYSPLADEPVGRREGWPIYRYWGVGQPAATSVDGQGRVLLFYTRADVERGEEVVELDLSDLDAGIQRGMHRKLPTDGLKPAGAAPLRPLANIAVVYDTPRDRFLMVREGDHPPTDGRFPPFVSSAVQIAEIAGAAVWSGEGAWRVLGSVSSELTGWPRNHNPGVLRAADGVLPDPSRLTVAVSTAEAYDSPPPDFEWLWTYRLCVEDVPLE